MYSFPLYLALIPYTVVVAIFSLMALIHVHHLIHYGAAGRMSFCVTFLFLGGAGLNILLTWWLLLGTDWNQAMQLGLPSLSSYIL